MQTILEMFGSPFIMEKYIYIFKELDTNLTLYYIFTQIFLTYDFKLSILWPF